MLRAYNAISEFEGIDWDVVEGDMYFEENLTDMQDRHPEFNWTKEDVEKKMYGDKKWEDLMQEEDNIIEKIVQVKKHKIKSGGKIYENGRIQISVDKKFIGCTAKVIVEIYVPKKPESLTPEEVERRDKMFDEIFEEREKS